MNGNKITTPLIICGTIIIVVLIGGVLFMSQGSNDNVKFIIINGMLGSIGTLAGVLFVGRKVEQAADKADEAAKKVDEMHDDLKNGLIPEKVQEGMQLVTARDADPNDEYSLNDKPGAH